jgi:predicted HicB family RNase H-like nuclease
LSPAIGVRLPRTVRQAAERIAMARGISLSQLAREAIAQAVAHAAGEAR